MKRLLLIFTSCIAIAASADVFQDYIDRYYLMAIEQQEAHGIPASITLSQGILESGAGRSTLAKEGNNHFGIKCHSDWKGASMLRDDDAPNECFRVYNSPEESFHDHSLFLKKKRYQSLFDLPVTDYKGWATGLKRCGYATDPNYAARLITIIERYGLYNFDTMGIPSPDETAEFIQGTLAATHRVRKSHGLYYVVALPGDTYKSLAKEFKIKEKTLKGYNDSPKKGVIREWEEIYLQPKNEEADCEEQYVAIGEDEDMRSISQRYGITLSSLKKLNPKAKDRPGTVLKLK